MAITKKLTKPPEPPKRSDPDTFADKADTFVEWMTQFGYDLDDWTAQVNATAEQMNLYLEETKTARDEAIASVDAEVYDSSKVYNYPDVVIGSDGHCYRCLGESVSGDDPVSSASGNWLKLTLTASEVEDYVDEKIKERFGRITEISLDTGDVELTESNMGLVVVTSASGNYCVKFASASTFTSLGWKFTILNKTNKSVLVRNNLGGLLTAILPSDYAKFTLVDNNTQHGRWLIFQGRPVGAYIYAPHDFEDVFLPSGISYFYRDSYAVPLSNSEFVYVFYDQESSYLKACVFKVDSNREVTQVSEILTLTSFPCSRCFGATKLSDSEVFVLFRKWDSSTPDYSIYGCVLLWDGSSLSLKVSATLLKSDTQASCVLPMRISSSEVFISGGWESNFNGGVISYDGSSLTWVTEASSSQSYDNCVAILTTSSGLWSASQSYVFHWSYDGVSITCDAEFSLSEKRKRFLVGSDVYYVRLMNNDASHWHIVGKLSFDGANIEVVDFGREYAIHDHFSCFFEPFEVINGTACFLSLRSNSFISDVVLCEGLDGGCVSFRRLPVVLEQPSETVPFNAYFRLQENIFVEVGGMRVIELTQLAYPDVVKGGV